MPKLETLKSKQAFLRVKAKGQKYYQKNFIIQALYHENSTRWGFIITKKMGSAVTRNFIRRRLKEIIRQLSPLPQADYVIIPRVNSHAVSFNDLRNEFHMAFNEIYATSPYA